MKRLYVYEINNHGHVVTIICETEEECEKNAMDLFSDVTGYAWTFTPRFGRPGGLKRDSDAAILDYRIGK